MDSNGAFIVLCILVGICTWLVVGGKIKRRISMKIFLYYMWGGHSISDKEKENLLCLSYHKILFDSFIDLWYIIHEIYDEDFIIKESQSDNFDMKWRALTRKSVWVSLKKNRENRERIGRGNNDEIITMGENKGLVIGGDTENIQSRRIISRKNGRNTGPCIGKRNQEAIIENQEYGKITKRDKQEND